MPNISFDDFRELATRPGLKTNQRVDDPTDIRVGKHDRIFADIVGKLPVLAGRDRVVVEIGPGCGPLAFALIDLSGDRGHRLWLVDSAEMLAHLPDPPFVTKAAGRFPGVFREISSLVGKADAVLAYGMLHYVFEHDNIWAFLDRGLALLAPGGCLLLGDVPNWSRRKRMLSAQGQAFPSFEPRAGEIWPGGLTDSVLFGLMGRAAESGFDPFLLPQPDDLPMAGWRVDLLFRRPG
jgi:hypothetical protein